MSFDPPSLWRLFAEARCGQEYAAALALAPLLRTAPRGDGHIVLVLPGFLAGDESTWPLRTYLNDLGYESRGWRLGPNVCGFFHMRDRVRAEVERLYQEKGAKVSLIGWSLGGLFARDVGLFAPQAVRCVITLGSPIVDPAHSTYLRDLYEAVTGERIADAPRDEMAALAGELPVPATSIYSRGDGFVTWRASVVAEGPRQENIEIRYASHIGLGANPAALWAIADRLAQAEGAFKPFAPKGPLVWAYAPAA